MKRCSEEELKEIRSKSTIAFLDATSWVGMSIGAVHWYGSLSGNKNGYDFTYQLKVDVNRILTTSSAKRENKMSERFHFNYKKGDEAGGWFDKEALYDKTIEIYKNYYPNAKLLLRDDTELNPSQVLDCISQKDMNAMNKIYERFKNGYTPSGNWIDDNYMEECYKDWKPFIKKYKNLALT